VRKLALIVVLTGAVALGWGATAGATRRAAEGSAAADIVPGAIGVKLLDPGPSSDPQAQIYIVATVAPGDSLDRRVAISNGTDANAPVDAYLGGARLEHDQFVPDDHADEIVRWATVSPASVQLAPNEESPVDVHLAVPRDASAGAHYGVVWAQTAPAVGVSGISTVNRVGVRVLLTVTGDGASAAGGQGGTLALTGGALTLAGGALLLVLLGIAAVFVQRRMRVTSS
jgi:hypothetical protein